MKFTKVLSLALLSVSSALADPFYPPFNTDFAGDGIDANGDGIDGDILASVFVSLDTGNDSWPGTIDLPKRTITSGAWASWLSGRGQILVAFSQRTGTDGMYHETVDLPYYASIVGGYHPVTWARTANPAIIKSSRSGGALFRGLGVVDESLPTLVSNLRFVPPSTIPSAGQSSVGIVIERYPRHSPLTFDAIVLEVPQGAAGSPGEWGSPGAAGAAGKPGSNSSGGGEPGTPGRGGNGGVLSFGFIAGFNGAPGLPPLGGAGGKRGSSGGGNGFEGTNGGHGAHGTGGLASAPLMPFGGDGTPGQEGGQGGGGGGGGNDGVFFMNDGGGGGQGGFGGKGATPGKGGMSGGSSIGIWITEPWIWSGQLLPSFTSTNLIFTSNGALAGPGGFGSAGGIGGQGGEGEGKPNAGDGADGARGGLGGTSGGGAGGNGGSSIGLLYTALSDLPIGAGALFIVGTGAAGGAGLAGGQTTAPGNKGENGRPGVSSPVFRTPMTPDLRLGAWRWGSTAIHREIVNDGDPRILVPFVVGPYTMTRGIVLSQPQNGEVVPILNSVSFSYTPRSGFYGLDSFRYMLGTAEDPFAATGQAVVMVTKGLSGIVTLNDYIPTQFPSQPVVVEWLNAQSRVIRRQQVTAAPNGGFSTWCPFPFGPARVRIKVSHWLAKAIPVNTATGNPNLSVSLINGDCDGDNEITIFDYIEISNAFDTEPTASNWNPNADLDGDRAVTIFDYIILSQNFGLQGD